MLSDIWVGEDLAPEVDARLARALIVAEYNNDVSVLDYLRLTSRADDGRVVY